MGLVPKILLTADWHLHHPRVSTSDTISDIKEYLFPKIPEADIMIIAGDIFDTSVSMNSDCATKILELFFDIFIKCFEGNTILRVMQGTFTHDRLQLRILNKLYKKLQMPLNFRLVDKLDIEYIEAIDKHLLYLPDNLPYKHKEAVFEQVRKLLTVTNLKMVDYTVCHGEFSHACFGFVNHNSYEAADFKELCRSWVMSGHIHKPSKHGQIIYSGSINRLAHNEEEAKGFWFIDSEPKFIENKSATKFITIVYKEADLEALISRHKKVIKTQFDPKRAGALRLIIDDVHLRQAIRGYHDKHYPNIRLTFKKSKQSKDDDKYLECKLKSTEKEKLEEPSLKNISSIVCKHLLIAKKITIDLEVVENVINGGI